MEEKKFILTESQLNHILRFASMGGAGILSPDHIDEELKAIPEEIRKKVLANTCTAACIRTEGPIGAILKILEMEAKREGGQN